MISMLRCVSLRWDCMTEGQWHLVHWALLSYWHVSLGQLHAQHYLLRELVEMTLLEP